MEDHPLLLAGSNEAGRASPGPCGSESRKLWGLSSRRCWFTALVLAGLFVVLCPILPAWGSEGWEQSLRQGATAATTWSSLMTSVSAATSSISSTTLTGRSLCLMREPSRILHLATDDRAKNAR